LFKKNKKKKNKKKTKNLKTNKQKKKKKKKTKSGFLFSLTKEIRQYQTSSIQKINVRSWKILGLIKIK
jgi:hypothetical protein